MVIIIIIIIIIIINLVVDVVEVGFQVGLILKI